MTPQPKSPNADLDRLDALNRSQLQAREDWGNNRISNAKLTAIVNEFRVATQNAYPALSKELRELRERLNSQPCTACGGTGRVDTNADDGGSNCGVCRNGMVDEVSRQLSENERLRAEIDTSYMRGFSHGTTGATRALLDAGKQEPNGR